MQLLTALNSALDRSLQPLERNRDPGKLQDSLAHLLGSLTEVLEHLGGALNPGFDTRGPCADVDQDAEQGHLSSSSEHSANLLCALERFPLQHRLLMLLLAYLLANSEIRMPFRYLGAGDRGKELPDRHAQFMR